MKVQFKKSFAKDLRKVKDKDVLNRIKEIIKQVEEARKLPELAGIKRLRINRNYYRIRIGDYRAGLIIEEDVVTFVRFLHRREFYRYF